MFHKILNAIWWSLIAINAYSAGKMFFMGLFTEALIMTAVILSFVFFTDPQFVIKPFNFCANLVATGFTATKNFINSSISKLSNFFGFSKRQQPPITNNHHSSAKVLPTPIIPFVNKKRSPHTRSNTTEIIKTAFEALEVVELTEKSHKLLHLSEVKPAHLADSQIKPDATHSAQPHHSHLDATQGVAPHHLDTTQGGQPHHAHIDSTQGVAPHHAPQNLHANTNHADHNTHDDWFHSGGWLKGDGLLSHLSATHGATAHHAPQSHHAAPGSHTDSTHSTGWWGGGSGLFSHVDGHAHHAPHQVPNHSHSTGHDYFHHDVSHDSHSFSDHSFSFHH